MKNLLRALIAGWGARAMGRKMGCGCVGTVLLFVVLFWLLGVLF